MFTAFILEKFTFLRFLDKMEIIEKNGPPQTTLKNCVQKVPSTGKTNTANHS